MNRSPTLEAKEKPATLIVGADSFIGRALIKYPQHSGGLVIGTTRQREKVNKSCLFLDLMENMEKWKCPLPISVAVICAGITKLEACRSDPATGSRVNVKGVSDLVKNLVTNGTFVIYLSSNQVFDGSKPYRKPDDPVSPITEYGRQKAEVERYISQWNDSVAIVRFTKVLGPTFPLFSQWSEMLEKSKTIRPFSNMYMSPIPLSCAVSVLRLVIEMRLSGIMQVSGSRDISYEEVARLGAKVLRVEQNLVQPIKSPQSNLHTDQVPTNTTLNIDRLRSTLGIEPPNIQWTVEMAFARPNVLAPHSEIRENSI